MGYVSSQEGNISTHWENNKGRFFVLQTWHFAAVITHTFSDFKFPLIFLPNTHFISGGMIFPIFFCLQNAVLIEENFGMGDVDGIDLGYK